MKIPALLLPIARKFHDAGFQCYLVGGAVRNMVMNKKPEDFDIATDASPSEVQRLFRRVIPTGVKHGTVTVLSKGRQFEVTTFRIEGKYSDARHPDEIQFSSSIFDDLKRRDFTINALALDLASGELIDPHDGMKDVRNMIIRAIGKPEERFQEDGLRTLRAIRFSVQLKFTIEKNTLEAIKAALETVESLSEERIRDELEKILLSEKPSAAFHLMDQTGLLEKIIPELSRCKDTVQDGFHSIDVFEHSVLACDAAPRTSLPIRLAALLHDIGKPDTAHTTEERKTFYRHEEKSAELAESLLRRLRFPSKLIQHVTHLIRHHMFHYEENWTDSAVRRFLSRVGIDSVDDLFALRKADYYALTGTYSDATNLPQFEKRIHGVLSEQHALTIGDLKVNGHVLMQNLGIPPGPEVGLVLAFLHETVLDDPTLNKKEKLISLAKYYYENYIKQKD